MKRGRTVGFDSRSRYAMPLNPPRANFAADCHSRQHPGNFKRGEIFKEHQVEQPVLQICLRSQPQTSSVTRRVQNPQHKSRSLQKLLLRTFQGNAHMDSMEFSERANGGEKIPAPSVNLAVNPAREPRCLSVQSYSSSAHVQSFLTIGSAHTRRIQVNGFSLGQNQLRGLYGIERQSQSGGQIVSSSGRQHPDGNTCVSRHSVQERLKRPIAPKRKDTLASRGSFFARDLSEFRGTLRAAKFRAPMLLRSKCLQTRESLLPKPAAGCRVCQN